MLLDQTARHALDVWHAYGRCFKGMLLIKRGDVDLGLRLLGAAVDELRGAKFVQCHTAFLGGLAEGFAAAGQAVQGLTAIDEALARSELTEERWATAELLRIKGELLLLQNEPKAAAVAEEHFVQALDWGRRQEALSWELRGATSHARLWHRQRRTSQAAGCWLLSTAVSPRGSEPPISSPPRLSSPHFASLAPSAVLVARNRGDHRASYW